jgi:hypothetical protein
MLNNEEIFSEPFNIVKSFLEGLKDPRNRFKQRWVYDSRPLVDSREFSGFPFMVLKVDVTENKKSHDVVTSEKQFDAVIHVEARDGSQIDNISNQIFSKFKDEDELGGLDERRISSSPLVWFEDLDGKKTLRRTIVLRFRSRV